MLQELQKRKITESILKSAYESGYVPKYGDLSNLLIQKFKYVNFGKPLFSPRGAAHGLIVNPKDLKLNVSEIRDDLDLSFEDINEIIKVHQEVFSSSYSRYIQSRQKLTALLEDLNNRLRVSSIEMLGSNFRDTSNVDLENTTAYVDTSVGMVTLPLALDTSTRYQSSDMVKVSETHEGCNFIGDFLHVFNDSSNNVWQAEIIEGGYYQTEINLTGKPVIAGNANEVEVNRISIDPIGHLNLVIQYSTDGFNWTDLFNKSIIDTTIVDLKPTWILLLRFRVSGVDSVGIRHITIGRVGTSNYGVYYSKPFVFTNTIPGFDFSVDQEIPYGTSIRHYIKNGMQWLPIVPGHFNFNTSRYITLSLFTSGDFVADNPADSITLYSNYLSNVSIPNGSSLWRGVNQFKVEAFQYDFQAMSDGNHIPEISDWNSNYGIIHTSYMHSAGNINDDTIPGGVYGNKSFIITASNAQQDWWGVTLHSTGSTILPSGYSYRITTHLYSDRNVLISNFAGGVYVRNPDDVSDTPANPTNLNSYGWSLYVNGNNVGKDNKYYSTAIPGSGDLLSSEGKSFPVALNVGWNRLELLIYVPTVTFIDSVLSTGFNIFLLFRPNLFNFSLSNTLIPSLVQYPIWADGKPLDMVSEFYLKWNTSVWDHSKWAWRLNAVSGTPIAALLNYDPNNINYTIDGVFSGDSPQFNLNYIYTDQPVDTILYKAELRREPFSNVPPRLNSYKFTVT